jgi:translation initiation factor 1 (eIF-1/SUI1)
MRLFSVVKPQSEHGIAISMLLLFGSLIMAADRVDSFDNVIERDLAQRAAPSKAKPSLGRGPAKMSGKTGVAAKAPATVTPEVEARVMQFVETHQSELGELLRYLKSQLPGDYRQAIQDLDRTQQRLAQTQRRDELRYELELKLWQMQSQAQLLAAKIRTQQSDRESLTTTLRATLKQAQQVRIQLMEREQAKLLERVEKIESNLDRLREHAERNVEREISALVTPKSSAASR